MKDIKDYLHLYLGCEVEVTLYGKPYHAILKGIGLPYVYIQTDGDHAETTYLLVKTLLKPILRHLSDMTVEEDRECHNIMFGEYFEKFKAKGIIHFEAEKIKYLLSRGFDLFGLIEEKLALDKTKLKDRGL